EAAQAPDIGVTITTVAVSIRTANARLICRDIEIPRDVKSEFGRLQASVSDNRPWQACPTFGASVAHPSGKSNPFIVDVTGRIDLLLGQGSANTDYPVCLERSASSCCLISSSLIRLISFSA